MIAIQVDSKSVVEGLVGMQRQIPFAMSKGINAIASGLKGHVVGLLPSIIDRPTKYTLNSLKVTPSDKRKLVAVVGFKVPAGRSSHYLEPIIKGGPRHKKAFELALGGSFLVPGRAADGLGMIDSHGNFKRSEIQRIMSWFGRSQRTSGYTANMTAATRAKRMKLGRYENGRKLNKRQLAKDPSRGYLTIGGYQYFISLGRGAGALGQQHLAKGIWRKSGTHGVKAMPVLMASKAPQYRKQFDFYGIAQQYVNANGKRLMAEAVAYTIRTAR